ncbi:MAG: UbiX family flavin prenyltransferase [Candidatus Odinarchaeia archaeon]
MKLIVGITGASGVIYGIRLIEELSRSGNYVITVVSEAGKRLFSHEALGELTKVKSLSDEFYEAEDFNTPIVSGSFKVDGMIICPCSMKTVSAIANGYSANALIRAADCCLKEGRKLVLVFRETPLNQVHLENLLKLSRVGAIILPASPGFYHNPKNIGDVVNFIVGKILDQFNIENELYKRWKA